MKEFISKIFKNGKIYTMDPNKPLVGALAISNSRISYAGSNLEVEGLINPSTEIVDLKGKTVLPGFIDTHLHAPGNAYIKLFNIYLYGARSSEDTLAIIRDHIRKNPAKEIYYGQGFNSAFFDGLQSTLGPRKELLDEICNDKPVVLTDFGGHVMWMNSEAFKKFNITEKTIPPKGGVIEKNPDTGALWGTVKEYAKTLVPTQTFTDAEAEQAVAWFQKNLHRNGYTAIFALRPSGSLIPRETIFPFLSRFEKKGLLQLRINGARDMDNESSVKEQVEELIALKQKYESDLIKVRTAKYFADGVIEGLTGYLTDPYEQKAGKDPSYKGELIWDLELMEQSFKEVLKAGFQIHVHTIGDGAVKATLDVLQSALSKVPNENHRTVFTHLQLVRPEDVLRMAKLGVIANIQAYWHFKSPTMWFPLEHPLLGSRAENEYPLKSFLTAGAMITASSDYPITPEPNPFWAIQTAVTRNLTHAEEFGLEKLKSMDDPRWLLNQKERVAVKDMIQAYTINGAFQLFREDEIGSIREGKCADMIVLDKDPYAVEPLEIENIKVLETIFGGNTVFQA